MTLRRPFRGLSIFWQTLLLLAGALALAQFVSAALFFALPPPRPDYNRLSDIADTLAGRRFDPLEQGNRDSSERSLILTYEQGPPQPLRPMIADAPLADHFARHVGAPVNRVRLYFEPDQTGGFPFNLRDGKDPVPYRRGEPIFYNSVVAGLDTGHGWRVIRTEARPLVSAWQKRSMVWFATTLLLLLPVAWFFARRLSRPIAKFAEAAELLGQSPSAAPMNVDGPPELRIMGDAFNRMQARIAEYLRERTMMIGAIAHDLRTPLARIAFRIEDAPDSIRIPVQGDVEKMRSMIAATIDFTKGATRHYERRSLDLTALLGHITEEQVATGGSVTFTEALPAMVNGDHVALTRLFQNLIDNAAHYAGSAEIEMAQEPNRIIVTVQDRGPGLPNDMLTSALEPFVRNEPSRNRATGGVGLGLTIARSIAIDHGGAICLRARKGGGLCARVELPSFGSCA